MIAPCDQFGPWRPDITDAERLARLRSLRAIAHLTLGPRGEAFADALRLSERNSDLRDLFDADELEEADEAEVAAVTGHDLHSLFDRGYLRRNGILADDGSGGQG